MAIGDQNDFVARMRRALTQGWFPSNAPVLTAILSGPASAAAWLYDNLQYVIQQTRIATATGAWLDMASQDFFGGRLPRNTGETDAAFSARIRVNLFRGGCTRPAMVAALTSLTGVVPTIFEPLNPSDAGGYGHAFFYGQMGGWGSFSVPYQAFLTTPAGNATAAEIYAAVAAQQPAGCCVWTAVT